MSKIEWTDKTWNPVTGCTKVSQGCKNCYAERLYERFNGKGAFKNVICHQNRLSHPARWKRPAMVFVNSMSDLFHEDVPFSFINAVFSVMSDCDHHTYQVLTKRPARMLAFFKWKSEEHGIPWEPKPNVWIGVSVENQEAADERIPLLLDVPAAVRFLSCEPLLGPIKLWPLLQLTNNKWTNRPGSIIDWIICGGESGPGSRPMHPEWARSIRDQCQSAGVTFFFKQWGNWIPMMGHVNGINVRDEKFTFPDGTIMGYTNKKAGGRLLDGQIHDDFPQLKI